MALKCFNEPKKIVDICLWGLNNAGIACDDVRGISP